MYNGIGLQTARGSGTNGYVQRNLSAIRTFKDKVNFRTEDDIRKLEADIQKGPNRDILEHAHKRALELKCAEMEDIMKEEGYSEREVEEKVKQYRAMLMERDQNARTQNHSVVDLYGRTTVRETHAVAEAQQQKNARLKEAFGISEFFVEGSSLDPDRKTKEEAARQAHQLEEERRKRRHEWINTPTPSPTHPSSEQHKDKKDKKKKKKRTRDRSSSPESRKKRKSSKKSKRSRSLTPKKKKRRSRDKKKKSKVKKKRRSSSTSARSSSSSTDDAKSPKRRSSKRSSKELKAKEGTSSSSKMKKNSVKTPKKSDCQDDKNNEDLPKPFIKTIEEQGGGAAADRASPGVDKEKIEQTKSDKRQSRSRSKELDINEVEKVSLLIVTPPLPEEKSQPDLPVQDQSRKKEEIIISQAEPVVSIPSPSLIKLPPEKVEKPPIRNDFFTIKKQLPIKDLNPLNPNCNDKPKEQMTLSKKLGAMLKSPVKTSAFDNVIQASKMRDSPVSLFTNQFKGANLSPNKDETLRPVATFASFKTLSPTSTSATFNIIQNGNKKTNERSSSSRSPTNTQSVNISLVADEPPIIRPLRRTRSSSYSSSSSRSRSRSRSSMSISPLRHSHSPRSHRSSRSLSRSRSKSGSLSKSRSRSRSQSRSRSKSRSRSRSRSYSRSRSKSRSLSGGRYSRSSRSRSSLSRSLSRSVSRSLTRSRSRSQSRSRSPTRSRSKSKSRSPSIPRRKGSPSFLDKRRITSARKRPVPYHRPTPPPSPSSSSSESSWWSRSRSRSRSWSRTRSPTHSR